MPLYNYDSAMKGIYRAILLTNDTSNNARLYIPSICNNSIPCPLYSDGSLNTSVYNNNINSYFQARWVNPNLSQLSSASGPVACWVIFENGNINYPVIIAYFSNVVLTGALSFSSGAPGNTYSGGVLEDANAMAIFNRLIWHGASIGGACALLGMIHEESKWDPTLENSIGAVGLCQWYAETRKGPLINGGEVGGKSWPKPTNYKDLNTQVDYMVLELQYANIPKSPTWDEICKEYNNINDILDLMWRLVRYFEVPFDVNSKSELSGVYLINYENAEKECIKAWNILKNGTIQNGKYISNNVSGNNTQKAFIEFARTFKGGNYSGTDSSVGGYCQAWVADAYYLFFNRQKPRMSNATAGGAGKEWGLYRISDFPSTYRSANKPSCTLDSVPLGATIWQLYSASSGDTGHVGVYAGDGMFLGNHGGANIPSTKPLTNFSNAGYTDFVWGWNGGSNYDLTKV